MFDLSPLIKTLTKIFLVVYVQHVVILMYGKIITQRIESNLNNVQ